MLALKYGEHMDEGDFLSKAEVRCDLGARLSPEKLAEALNSEPAMRVKDVSHDRQLQIRLGIKVVSSFAELKRRVKLWPGTCFAVAAVSADSSAINMVAVCREAYDDSTSLVAKAQGRKTLRGARSAGLGPLLSFRREDFQSAVILEPVIEKVVCYESDRSRIIELQVPQVSPEFAKAALQSHSQSADGARRVCNVLSDLVRHHEAEKDSKPGVAAAGACMLVLNLMESHLCSAHVQASACASLKRLIPGCSSTDAVTVEQTSALVEALTAAMRKHPSSPEVQETACEALASVLTGRSEMRAQLQSAASTNGAVEQVVAAMRESPDSVRMQTWGCGALAGLSANHPMNQTAIAGSRGPELVAAAMCRHPEAVPLQTMACGAFGNLATNHRGNQYAIAACGGLELVLEAARRHLEVAGLQQAAVGAMWSLVTQHPENQTAAARMGGAEVAVAAVQRHPGDQRLRTVATGALQVLVPGLGSALASASARSAPAHSRIGHKNHAAASFPAVVAVNSA